MPITKHSLSAILVILAFVLLASCSSTRSAFDPGRKYAPEKLKKDYALFRNILEESHPGLYWYTPKDSMDVYFDQGYALLKDSMTEPAFRSVLSYVLAKVRCGHTSTRYSRQYTRWLDTARLPSFPISIKELEQDTVLLNNTLQRSNITLKRGTRLTRLNGEPLPQLLDTLKSYIPNDGYNESYLRQALSNRGALGGWLRLVKGWQKEYSLGYIDSLGMEQETRFRLVEPPKPADTTKKPAIEVLRKPFRKKEVKEERLLSARNIQFDTALSTAYMTVNTFNNGYSLPAFFKESFHALRKLGIRHLVIDLRSNGGGNVSNSNILTRYILDKPFKVADSLYAVSKRSKYGDYVQYNSITGIFFSFITRKRKDGNYHFGYFERHHFKPKRNGHYNGNVYVLIGPNSFSATAIFAGTVKGQPNVLLIGEETGGAAYGNNAWFIPNVTLPETGVRFRLPKFRLVINKDMVKDGRGVLPDVEVKPTTQSVRENIDPKVEYLRKLILNRSQAPVNRGSN
ncbi:S41 family peptidase [Flavihumibacter rivuli]|uniref:S41 family peptidase n=1 Tax=Flavihumibacter rivuli TaxID=2838156 RepID=UPI001BDE5889|nr:S41 family peptidase [Flavihumibacter rivuli]ULQ55619.1 S41 family peptidase [Flavihumibacter rivuli]